ncbi:MAG: DUF6090 family protein [Bacteroidota bacterium]
MLRFFRRIRQDLLREKRFSSYLFYALGEIILVVAGILIALQIDNWNTKKKNLDAERAYLKSLNIEFATNLVTLENTLKENEDLIKALDKLTGLFDPDTLESISEKKVALFLNPLGKEVVYYPVRGVMNDIISSGNLNLIRNSELRQKIASFNNELKRVENQERVASEIRANVMQITSQNGSFAMMFAEISGNKTRVPEFRPKSNKQLFTVLELENNLELYKQVTLTTNNYFYKGLKKNIEDILHNIEKDLN